MYTENQDIAEQFSRFLGNKKIILQKSILYDIITEKHVNNIVFGNFFGFIIKRISAASVAESLYCRFVKLYFTVF